MSRKLIDILLKKYSAENCILFITLAIVAAIVAIGISVHNGAMQVGYSVVDVCAVLVAFIGSCVSVYLTVEINRLAEQNRVEEKNRIEREKYYAQIQAQAASFPQFKIDACTVYDMDELLTMNDEESQTVCGYIREHEPIEQKKYLLRISSKEAFPAYYKVDVKATKLILKTDRQTFQVELPDNHCWVTNNEQFSFWINFDDPKGLVNELKEAINEWIPGEKVYLKIGVDFSCANILLEWDKNPPLYRVDMECLAKKGRSNPKVQVELKVEHRYLSRKST